MKASKLLRGLARAIYAAQNMAGHGGEDFSSLTKMAQKKDGSAGFAPFTGKRGRCSMSLPRPF